MAMACPVHAISTGIGKASTRSASSKPARTMVSVPNPPARSTSRSKPAENTPGRPASTTTAPSAAARSNASLTSPSMDSDIVRPCRHPW